MVIDRSGPELSRSATEFGENEWFVTLQQALRINELIEGHSTIMDQYDPQQNVGLYVGEWGTWHSVEPGTNPGFLYQQNTLRDALVAGLSLNIFNRHSDRVQMANIAQTVNVLQAMVLTDEEEMILTPTYHVFEMYKVHQNATLLPTHLDCVDYTHNDQSIPSVSASASMDEAGTIHITLCNLDPENSIVLNCELRGMDAKNVTGRILTASAMNAHNTFDNPDAVHPVVYQDFSLRRGLLTATLPAKSVVVLAVE